MSFIPAVDPAGRAKKLCMAQPKLPRHISSRTARIMGHAYKIKRFSPPLQFCRYVSARGGFGGAPSLTVMGAASTTLLNDR